jgi:hypothetical protein
MRQFCLLFTFLIFSITHQAQNVGIGTSSPDPSAKLDVYSTDKGMLIPRVALTAANVASPITNPATGLLVFNTDSAGTDPNNVIPGFYYWTGSRWYPVVNKGKAPGDMQYWDGTKWVSIPLGVNGSVLTLCNGVPRWGGCEVLVTLSADPQFQGMLDNYYDTEFQYSLNQNVLDMGAWTHGGSPQNRRVLIKFDYSSIPVNATIDSARLFLYTYPNPVSGNLVDANYGSANSGWIQRITSPWTVWDQYFWNNQPTVTTVNQVVIPQSTSPTSNVELVITDLVRDMRTSGNNGFQLRMQTEVAYNIRQWGGSGHTNPVLRPKLMIWYH